MTALRVSLYGLCALSAIGLSACGEGYVTEEYYGVPYTEERTAHHGVAYVRARMAPPAGPVVEPVAEDFGPEEPTPLQGTQVPEPQPPIQSAEPLFDQSTKK